MAGSKGGKRRDNENHYRRVVLEQALRERILRLLFDDREASAAEIASELDEALGRVAYHLRLLVRHRVLKVVPKQRPALPLYRWSADAQWARKLLDEEDA